eukprot:gene5872-11198_t
MAGADLDVPAKELSISCEAEFKEYPYNKEVDIWTLVTVKAPCHELEESRAPIDIVAVIDKSGSMSGTKLQLVKTTMEFVVGQLKSDDRLSIVTYDTNVTLDFKLMKMTKDNKTSCLEKIRNISSGNSTNLSGGLLKGLEQMAERQKDKNELASVLLFTDGLANHGITSAQGIIAAMRNPNMFSSPSRSNSASQAPRHQSWLQRLHLTKSKEPTEHVEQSSAKEEEKEEEKKEATLPCSVYTFGFGNDHDPAMLKAISDAGSGMYYFVENEDKISESFGHCLGGLLSTVGQGIQLNLSAQDGVKIKEIHVNRSYDLAPDAKSLKVDLGDLQSEEERDVVLLLTANALPSSLETTPQPLIDVEVNYYNVLLEKLANTSTSLGVLRTNIEENSAEKGSVVVNKQRDRIQTTNAINTATEMADRDDFEAARQVIEQQARSNRSKSYANDEYLCALNQDLETCNAMMSSKSVWHKKGKKVQINM